jgi:hypothetical protein
MYKNAATFFDGVNISGTSELSVHSDPELVASGKSDGIGALLSHDEGVLSAFESAGLGAFEVSFADTSVIAWAVLGLSKKYAATLAAMSPAIFSPRAIA